jgi:aspartyl-tRNA synthetase
VEENRLVSVHHPFTAPRAEDLSFLEQSPLKVRSRSYDLVLNGVELGGGSIRIHETKMQKRVFSLLGLSDEEAAVKFGFLLDALQYGAPPHGGIAFGLDRILMLLQGEDSIRDVIPFPKTTSGTSPLSGAPDSVSPQQLSELGLRLI